MRILCFALIFTSSILVAQNEERANWQFLLEQADSLQGLKTYEEAHQYYKQALEILIQNAKWEKAFETGLALANNLQKQGSLKQAIASSEKLIKELAPNTPQPSVAMGNFLHKLGVFYYLDNDYNKAQQTFERAILLRQQLAKEHELDLARSHHNLGVVLKEKGNLTLAIKHLQEAIRLRKTHSKPTLLADSYHELGIVYEQLGDYDQALATHLTNLAILEQNNPDINYKTGRTYSETGIVYRKRKTFDKALKYLKKSQSIFNELYGPNDVDVARAYTNIGNTLADQKKFEEALSNYQKAHKIYEAQKNDPPNLARNLNNIGIVYKHLGKYELAVQALEKSLALKQAQFGEIHPENAFSYDNLGDVYLSQNNYSEALKFYQLAICQHFSDYCADDILTNPVFEQHTLTGQPRQLLTVLASKAKTLCLHPDSRNQPAYLETAIQCYKLCDQLISTIRRQQETTTSKLFLLEEVLPIYEAAIQTSFDLYELNPAPELAESALQFMEKSKSVLLLTTIREDKARFFAKIPDSLLQRESNFKADINYLERKRAQLILEGNTDSILLDIQNGLTLQKQAFNEFISKLEKSYPAYYREKYRAEGIEFSTLKPYLQTKNISLLSYFVGKKQLYILAVQSKKDTLIQIELKAALNPLVDTLLNAILSPENPNQDFAATAFNLYQLLWEPIESFIGQTVIISPFGKLNYLPFEALLSQEVRHLKFKQYPYLIRKYQLSYTYSGTVLIEAGFKPTSTTSRPFIGVAPIFENSGEYAYLPHSETEVSSLKSLLGGKVLLRQAASKTSFLKEAIKYRIIHISSHAAIDDTGWIAFSDAGAEKGENHKLHLHELYDLELAAELAVLSACQTGAGKLSMGEGVLSLARGLAYAGCQSTISSLWSVNHSSTNAIMASFYTQLRKGRKKNEALRLGKLNYLDDPQTDQAGAQPYYWAAFLLVGEPEAIVFSQSFNWLYAGLLLIVSSLFFFIRVKIKAGK